MDRDRKTVEYRLRRVLLRRGLTLNKSRQRDPKGLDTGKFVIIDEQQAHPVAGTFPGAGLTIEQVQAFVDDNETAAEPTTRPTVEVICSDALVALREMEADSIDCIVTSPPYYFQRDYQHVEQIGLERTRQAYLDRLLAVTAELYRVLRPTGTLWLNLADSICTRKTVRDDGLRSMVLRGPMPSWAANRNTGRNMLGTSQFRGEGIREGEKFNIPHLLVEAMRAQGWLYRAEITWVKNVRVPKAARMVPETVTEPVFMLTKAANGYTYISHGWNNVWAITPSREREAHTARMPFELAKRCILSSTLPKQVVLDPFGGMGTTAKAATQLGRTSCVIELNHKYAASMREKFGLVVPEQTSTA